MDGPPMPDTETMLPVHVSDLSYHAGGRTLINQVDLKIASKGITVIMGPNGAGKSLLLRLLHGLLPPTSRFHPLGRAAHDRRTSQTPGNGLPTAHTSAALGCREYRIHSQRSRKPGSSASGRRPLRGRSARSLGATRTSSIRGRTTTSGARTRARHRPRGPVSR